MVVRLIVGVIRVPFMCLCAPACPVCVPYVCPGSPRCLFTGTVWLITSLLVWVMQASECRAGTLHMPQALITHPER